MRLPLIAFCIGIAWLQQQADLPASHLFWLLPLLATALILPRAARPWSEALRRAAILILCAGVGIAWATWRAESRLADRLPAHWQGIDIELVGVVSDLPHVNAQGERFVFDVEAVLTAGAPSLTRVQLTRYWPRDAKDYTPRMRAGERWRLTTRLKVPRGTSNPHGFDLEGWMLERGVNASGYVRERPEPQRVAGASTTAGFIASTRAAVRDRIFATLPNAQYGGVIAALVVGDQRSIPHGQWRAFTRTGVNHLLSI